MLCFLMLFAFITGCSNSGSSGSGGSSGSAPVELGTLPNGSRVYVSANNLPLSASGSAEATISLSGGSPNESFVINYVINKALSVNRTHNVADVDTGISINPSSCTLGTAGSNLPTSCKLIISASDSTSAGTYTITPTAAPVSGGATVVLSPITLLVSGSTSPSSNAIDSFSLNGSAGTIIGNNIAVTVPYGTNVTNLVATYITTGSSVSVGSNVQVNGQTTNDFSGPVVYTVTAENGSTQNYTVSVTVAANTANAITAFSLNGTPGVISGQTITVEVPYGTSVTALIATYTTSGETVSVGSTLQVDGVTSNDFTAPVVYTVTAANGTTQNYTVTVTVAANTAKAITAFSLNGSAGTIVGDNIAVTVPDGTSVTALVATFTTTGTSVAVGGTAQVSTVTPNDFTSPVVYTVTAANGTTQNYTVTVMVAPPAYFQAFYPNGCTVNNTAAGIVGNCECIQDPATNKIWTVVGPNNASTNGSWDKWTGESLTAYNATDKCGLIAGGWAMPSAPNAVLGSMSASNPGGDWGDIATLAGANGTPINLGEWMNNNGFNLMCNYYWSSSSVDLDGAWDVEMTSGQMQIYQKTSVGDCVLLVHP